MHYLNINLFKLPNMKNELIATQAIDITNSSTIPNVHIFKVTCIGATDKQPTRIKIYSEYWQKGKYYSFVDGTAKASNSLDLAIYELNKIGFNIVAKANLANSYYLICDNFVTGKSNPYTSGTN